MIGRTIGGRYRITARIGGGGMSLVYRADDLRTGRPVAVKVLNPQYGADEEFVRRFRREASAAASLQHPNIVAIFDVGQEEDLYYIVMELVEPPRTLKQLIVERAPLPAETAVGVALQILSALEVAHANRIVHRDIKPHNILITAEGQCKVADFGIARAVTTNTMTHTGSIIGSAHYFSPEMARGAPAGEVSDLYSLGIVLYEMLTGALPFQGDSPISVAIKHVQEAVVPPTVLEPTIPLELEEIVMKALEKEPGDRYESATAMANDLRRFVDDYRAGRTRVVSGDFPTQRIAGLRRKPAAKPSRRWIGWVIAAVLLAALSGGGVWAYHTLVGYMDVPEVQVPDVRGKPVDEAQRLLTAAGLPSSVARQEASATVPVNAVVSQQPEGNSRVKQGRTVELVLSKGVSNTAVPDVRGLTQELAIQQLQQSNLKYTTHEDYTAEQAAGRVYKQDPRAGDQVPEGAVIDLWISKGLMTVPAVLGKTRAEAEQAIQQAGLTLGTPSYVASDKPVNTVLNTTPLPGATVQPNAVVQLQLSGGPPRAEITVQVPLSAPAAGIVTVELVDGLGTRTIDQRVYGKPGVSYKLPVEWQGPTAVVQVKVNGQMPPVQTFNLPEQPKAGAVTPTPGAPATPTPGTQGR